MRKRLIAMVSGGVMLAAVSAVSVMCVAPATAATTVSPAVNCIQNPSTNADQPSRYTGNGVYIRTGPSTSCTAVGQGFSGQSVTIHCISGSWVYLRDNATGVTGWSYSEYVSLLGGTISCG